MSTDPTALAREVLDLAHEDETVTVCSIPDRKAAALARAVIELTEKVERMEALADEMKGYAAALAAALNNGHMELEDKYDYIDHFARQLRAALNGDSA